MLPDPVLHRDALASASQLFLGLLALRLADEDQSTALQDLSARRLDADNPENVAFAPCKAASMLPDPVLHRDALASASQLFLGLLALCLAAEDQSTALQDLSARRLAAENPANVVFAPCKAASILPDPVLHREALASASQLFLGLYALRLAAEDQSTADRKSTRLNSSHSGESRMPSSA